MKWAAVGVFTVVSTTKTMFLHFEVSVTQMTVVCGANPRKLTL